MLQSVNDGQKKPKGMSSPVNMVHAPIAITRPIENPQNDGHLEVALLETASCP